jgi:hypothetical protein
MGSFHCVTSGCAKVVYREYEQGYLEYQYPNEAKQVIYGNNLTYTTINNPPAYYGGGCAKSYAVQYQQAIISNGAFVGWGAITTGGFLAGNTGPFSNPKMYIAGTDYGILEHWWFRFSGVPPAFPNGRTREYLITAINSLGQERTFLNNFGSGVKLLGFIASDGTAPPECDPPGECIFTVFKNGQQIFTRTAPTCPTVNVFPPQLKEEQKTIFIKKFPILERIEVVDYSYEPLGLNVVRGDIPDNCLNIYRNGVTALIPPPLIGVPYLAGNYDFIAQICSDTDCFPPEYEVICEDCECRQCPSNTCAVECGDFICCYGDDGVAIESIPKDEYCQSEGGGDFGGGGAGGNF